MAGSSREDFCPEFHQAIELIGRRWTGVIVRSMLNGATRFCDIAVAVPNMSDKMLAKRLKELEAQEIITRTVTPDTPVRVDYTLTAKGRALEGVLDSLGKWADRWVEACPQAEETRSRARRRVAAERKHRSRRAPSR
jgi:DNA-binding HxlR family transcriptional regulator